MVREYKNTDVKNNQLSDLGANNSIRDAHNNAEHALDVNKINSLVPTRYSKMELTYYSGTTNIEHIFYYGNGEHFEYDVTVRDYPMGKAEITMISFINTLPSNLDGKYFQIYDDAGNVGVWFNLNGSSTHPTTGCLRDIEVAITSGDSFITLADKLRIIMSNDSEFLASRTGSVTAISSISIGDKSDASSETSGLLVSSLNGVASLNGQYFISNSANNDIKYYIWYNINATGTDPLIPLSTGIEVQLIGNESKEEVASKTRDVLENHIDFKSQYEDNTIHIENQKLGKCDGYEDGTAGFYNYIVTKEGKELEQVARLDLTYDGNNNIKTIERS